MKKENFKIAEIFDLSKTSFQFLFKNLNHPYEVFAEIKNNFSKIVRTLDLSEYNRIKDGVYVHRSVTVLKSVYLGKNIIIGKDVDLRNSAFLRENVIIGDRCVVGNSCELKNVFMFNESAVPHFNYVGDSILGFRAHLGAGAITSNLKMDKSNVILKFEDGDIDTGLKKIGAIIGDNVEVGCNTVLNPGTVIGKNSFVYPLSSFRGTLSENMIYKSNGDIVNKEIR